MMARPAAEVITLRIPADDGAIAAGLADLDDKLSRWLTAMREAQDRLSEPGSGSRLGRLHPRAGQTGPGTARLAGPERNQLAETGTSVEPETRAEETPVVSQTTAQAEARGSLGLPGLEGEDRPEDRNPATPERRGSFGIRAIGPVQAEPAPASESSPGTPPTPIHEDETLLASLDAETAKAIRVMRRLSMGTRSVRELLAEYQATPTASKNARPAKKSWFSRNR